MSYNAKVIQIMIACPGDVKEEKQIIREAIEKWNINNSRTFNIVLMPVSWEKNSYPISGKPGQKAINEQLVDKSDILIAIFWMKFGTATDTHPSGTIEEISEFLNQSKPVMFYFSDCKINPSDMQNDEYKKIMEYRKNTKDLYHKYKTIEEFKEKIYMHLSGIINDKFKVSSYSQNESILKNAVDKKELSNQAIALLLKAIRSDGEIMTGVDSAGTFFQIDNELYLTTKEPRTIAKYKKGLKELLTNEFLLKNNENIYQVTDEGYELGEELEKKYLEIPKDLLDLLILAEKNDIEILGTVSGGIFIPTTGMVYENKNTIDELTKKGLIEITKKNLFEPKMNIKITEEGKKLVEINKEFNK